MEAEQGLGGRSKADHQDMGKRRLLAVEALAGSQNLCWIAQRERELKVARC
jgi:hypothetical protein